MTIARLCAFLAVVVVVLIVRALVLQALRRRASEKTDLEIRGQLAKLTSMDEAAVGKALAGLHRYGRGLVCPIVSFAASTSDNVIRELCIRTISELSDDVTDILGKVFMYQLHTRETGNRIQVEDPLFSGRPDDALRVCEVVCRSAQLMGQRGRSLVPYLESGLAIPDQRLQALCATAIHELGE